MVLLSPQSHPDSSRPHITVVFATSLDGKIGDDRRARARLGSEADRRHLQERVAEVDGVLMGAGTLRSEGLAATVGDRALVQARLDRGESRQPVQMIASASGAIAPDLPFFQQNCPRWLITLPEGAKRWGSQSGFDQVYIAPPIASPLAPSGTEPESSSSPFPPAPGIDWTLTLGTLKKQGIHRLALLGGGSLVAALLAIDAIDEWHLTLCPLLIGGENAPTPADGPQGFPANAAPRLHLKSVTPVGHEVFLHYVRVREPKGKGTQD